MSGPVLLVVAHGSRDPRHAATVRELCGLMRRQAPGVRVETAFLDHCAPAVPRVVDRLAAEGVREVVALPLLLTRAYHAKSDLPSLLRAAARPRADLRIRQAGVLGPSALLTAALERRLAEAGGPAPGPERARTGVVLAAAGSSDPEAVAAVEAVARAWQRSGWAAVLPAYASTAAPRTEDAVRELRRRGAARVAVAPYLLAPGRLPDRIAAGARAAGADVLAGVLGAAPEVAALALRRYAEAPRARSGLSLTA